MNQFFEQVTIIGYLQNILDRNLSTTAFNEVCDFFDNDIHFLGLEEYAETLLEEIDKYQNAFRNNQGARKLYALLCRDIQELLDNRIYEIDESKPGTIEKNIQAIACELSLDPIETDFFGLLVRYHIHEALESLIDDLITNGHLGILDCCAACIGCSRQELSKRLRFDGRLILSGLVNKESSTDKNLKLYFEMPDTILKAIQKNSDNMDNIRDYILGKPQLPSLEWEDFDHISTARDKLENFLKEVVRKKIPGINILLWGAPGTGKTEFCKTLAARLNMQLYSIGEKDEFNQEPSRKDRILSFNLAQKFFRNQNNNLFLFDEMDDLVRNEMDFFGGFKISSPSKVFLNRMLENSPVPTIWTINRPGILEDSTIRRMALAVEMKVPTAKSRKNVWKRLLDKNGLSIPEEITANLAEVEISPAIASNAVRFAKIAGSSLEDFQFAAQGIIKATKGCLPAPVKSHNNTYLPELVNVDENLSELADRLCDSKRTDFSLCLYGPPGTGKSEFIRYLAKRLEMQVLFKRASDLMSCWVGESEQNIARAFEEAKEQEAFLIFDEADSLLSDRRYAQRSWEISQVNEMLTWMESHPFPFACTTNLKERLDQASIRRFTFKYHFGYLKPKQILLAFQHFFNLDVGEKTVSRLQSLTPGDFAVVSKKSQFLGLNEDIEEILSLLEQEMDAKNEKKTRPVGFAR